MFSPGGRFISQFDPSDSFDPAHCRGTIEEGRIIKERKETQFRRLNLLRKGFAEVGAGDLELYLANAIAQPFCCCQPEMLDELETVTVL